MLGFSVMLMVLLTVVLLVTIKLLIVFAEKYFLKPFLKNMFQKIFLIFLKICGRIFFNKVFANAGKKTDIGFLAQNANVPGTLVLGLAKSMSQGHSFLARKINVPWTLISGREKPMSQGYWVLGAKSQCHRDIGFCTQK